VGENLFEPGARTAHYRIEPLADDFAVKGVLDIVPGMTYLRFAIQVVPPMAKLVEKVTPSK
jgi:hypothetical protein